MRANESQFEPMWVYKANASQCEYFKPMWADVSQWEPMRTNESQCESMWANEFRQWPNWQAMLSRIKASSSKKWLHVALEVKLNWQSMSNSLKWV